MRSLHPLSEMCPNRLRSRNNIIVEMAGIVLGANHFDHRAIIDAWVTLVGVPWGGESDGVLDIDIQFEGPAAVDQLETLADFFRLQLCLSGGAEMRLDR
jgi:hypothetical protein